MPFVPAIAEQRFVPSHVHLDELARTGRFCAASPDVVLEGVGQLAAGEWAAINRKDDKVGATWTPEDVHMPEGFARAYRDHMDGG